LSTLQVLFLLLVLAYLGGFLMGGRGSRGRGLPSGSEWLLAGFLLGPAALGAVGSDDLAAFSPVATVAVAWLALIVGLGFGEGGAGRERLAGLLGGVVTGAVAFAATAGVVVALVRFVPAVAAAFPDDHERLVLAVGVGAVLADTSRRAVRWAIERSGATGPLLSRLSDLTQGDDLVPLAMVGGLVSGDTSRGVAALPGGGLALGLGLGLLTAVLLGRRLASTNLAWSVLFGVSLLAAGLAEQADLLGVTTLFVAGLALGIASPLRSTLRTMASQVEGPVVLPALFIAGARLPLLPRAAVMVVGAALAARVLAKVVSGLGLLALSPTARRAGAPVMLALLPAGPLSVAIGLAVQMRYPGTAGDTVLAAAIAAAVLGEFVGAPALRTAALRASPSSPPPPPSPPAAAEVTG
jgi:hypothetical protein